jgi:hypothetical protein
VTHVVTPIATRAEALIEIPTAAQASVGAGEVEDAPHDRARFNDPHVRIASGRRITLESSAAHRQRRVRRAITNRCCCIVASAQTQVFAELLRNSTPNFVHPTRAPLLVHSRCEVGAV